MPVKVLCLSCRHYIESVYCEAFPGGIPPEIWQGDNNHSEPLEGQLEPIVFEPIPEQTYP